jgi:hypothetical protein
MVRPTISWGYSVILMMLFSPALVATPAMAAKTWKFAYTATHEMSGRNGPTVQRFDMSSTAYLVADDGGGIVQCTALLQWDMNNNYKPLGASGNCVIVDSNIITDSGSYIYSGNASTPYVNPNIPDRPKCMDAGGCASVNANFWRVNLATNYIEFCGRPGPGSPMYCFSKLMPH